uniref:USP domain-containing protein n=1 Tax=Eptatretus burgeri TaxID=7764 RepID=A0A8C4QJU7_EPTBU
MPECSGVDGSEVESKYMESYKKKVVITQAANRRYLVTKEMKKKKKNAAVLFQAAYRGYQVREEMKKQKNAAVILQATYRRYQVGKEMKELKKQKNAAVTIQATFRGYRVREEMKEQQNATTIQVKQPEKKPRGRRIVDLVKRCFGMKTEVTSKVFFPSLQLRLKWYIHCRIGIGLLHTENNILHCMLQCLAYTPPLANYFFSSNHNLTCLQTNNCLMCHMKHVVCTIFCHFKDMCTPAETVSHLKFIARHLKCKNQQDASTFLPFILEKLQESCLHGYEHLKNRYKDTTPIRQIFGGYICYQISSSCGCLSYVRKYKRSFHITLDKKYKSNFRSMLKTFFNRKIVRDINQFPCEM